MKLYGTREAARILGMRPRTVRYHAVLMGVGCRPGRDLVFTPEDLETMRSRKRKWREVERKEKRGELGLGPMYDPKRWPEKGAPNLGKIKV